MRIEGGQNPETPKICLRMKKIMLSCCFCALALLLQKNLMAQDVHDSAAAIGRTDPAIEIGTRHAQDASDRQQSETPALSDSSAKSATPKSSYWQGGLSYLSDNVYLGRKDSIKIPYVMPTIGYYHRSGLYAAATLGYAIVPGNSHIDMFSLETGYALTAGNFDAQISASKYFYSSKSYSVRSEIEENIVIDAGFDLHFIKPTFETNLNFGQQTDYIMTWGLQHTFYTANDAIDITPAVTMNSGTQNYYDSYYRHRKYSVTRKKTTINGTITATVIDPSAFKILDYEATLPINYTVGKFTFNFTPTLAIPINPAQVSRAKTPAGGTTTIKVATLEKLNNSFYWNLGFLFRF